MKPSSGLRIVLAGAAASSLALALAAILLAGAIHADPGTLYVAPGGNCGGAITVTNAIMGDPAFAADGYHVTSGSAPIDRGVNAGVTTDEAAPVLGQLFSLNQAEVTELTCLGKEEAIMLYGNQAHLPLFVPVEPERTPLYSTSPQEAKAAIDRDGR